MTPPDFGSAIWRKSTRSGPNGGQCVEMALLDNGGTVGLRDSKDRGSGPVLVFTAREWGGFITKAVGGAFGRG
ncbi:MAG: DUF397 domain-containing protein [Pseudonocardiaceae bacterium]